MLAVQETPFEPEDGLPPEGAGAPVATLDPKRRRGPFRPERLVTARQRQTERLSSFYFHALDLLTVIGWTLLLALAADGAPLSAPTGEILPLALAAWVALALLRAAQLYRFGRGERLGMHLAKLWGAFAGAGLLGALVALVTGHAGAVGAVISAAGLDMAVTIGGFIVGLAAALMGLGGAAPLVGLAVAPFLVGLIFTPMEAAKARGGAYDPTRARDYAVYGYPIAASLILALVLSSTDRLLLAAFLDEAAVGAYHAGYSLANRTLDVIFIWLGAAGGPAMVMALERGGQPALREAAREQGATFLLIALPAAAGLALVAQPLSALVVGEALRDQAAAITPLIAVSALLAGLTTYYFHQAFTLGRRTLLLLAAMAGPAGANVVLNLLLIPPMGVMGAALATALSFGVGLVASIALGRRAIALPMPWNALVRCGVATLVMTGAVLLVPAIGGFPELAAKAAVGAAVYGLAAWLLDAAGVRGHGSRVLKGLQARMAA